MKIDFKKYEFGNLVDKVDCSSNWFGGDYSTASSMERINPKDIIVSAGKNNSFGHPKPEIIKRFNDLGVNIHRTDETGDITLSTD